MRILVAVPDALQGEGIAHVLRDVAPSGRVFLCDKRNLLGFASPAEGRLGAAVLAHPWISLATLKAFHRRQPTAAVVVYSSQADAATHKALLAVNVAAVIANDALPDVVAATVRVAIFGHVSVNAHCLRQIETEAGRATSRSRRFAGLSLTPRQSDVLRLVALGRANKAIADELGIGLRTVKGHIAVILRALHVDNRRDAGRHARRWLARNEGRPGRSREHASGTGLVQSGTAIR
jgi:DNA-binding NarL/FixJ family response regulator